MSRHEYLFSEFRVGAIVGKVIHSHVNKSITQNLVAITENRINERLESKMGKSKSMPRSLNHAKRDLMNIKLFANWNTKRYILDFRAGDITP